LCDAVADEFLFQFFVGQCVLIIEGSPLKESCYDEYILFTNVAFFTIPHYKYINCRRCSSDAVL